ncbi:hypothetical protein ACL598_17045 [Bordetella bronchialis]|uniref:hypothetical protein n=1 Tax=Bordetella bronchialis TaxID=463025 RepID=UPI003CFDACCC
MNTPADKPDLPALAIITAGDKEVRQRWFTEKEVRRLLADERRKAQSEVDDLYQRLAETQVERDAARDERDAARRKALLDAAWAARPMSSGRAAETAILRMIDRKEPTK